MVGPRSRHRLRHTLPRKVAVTLTIEKTDTVNYNYVEVRELMLQLTSQESLSVAKTVSM